MRRLLSISTVLLAASLSFPAHADDPVPLDEARKVAGAIPPKLLKVLSEAIDQGGPENAIAVCNDKAPKMAAAASAETGWSIRRVSLKNRNPKAVPDEWERAVLEEFDRRAAAGEAPGSLEKAELLVEGDKKGYRYMKALPTQELCLSCHGTADRITPAVKARLNALYPEDKAVGYKLGEVRGAITLKRPQ